MSLLLFAYYKEGYSAAFASTCNFTRCVCYTKVDFPKCRKQKKVQQMINSDMATNRVHNINRLKIKHVTGIFGCKSQTEHSSPVDVMRCSSSVSNDVRACLYLQVRWQHGGHQRHTPNTQRGPYGVRDDCPAAQRQSAVHCTHTNDNKTHGNYRTEIKRTKTSKVP